MSNVKSICRIGLAVLLSAAGIGALSGCGYTEPSFKPNTVRVLATANDALDRGQQRNLLEVLDAAFGTPDDPRLPGVDGISDFIDIEKLHVAAGPVGRDANGQKHGLYREHCVHCHGVTGDGIGPTASFLNPYPRDYRRGIYKFKSTKGVDVPPTHDDLHRILFNGIAGTAMPSFKVLDEGEIDALVHYVKYLSLRGQVERRLILSLADESDYDPEEGVAGQMLIDPTRENNAEGVAMVTEAIESVVASWQSAQPAPAPEPPEDYDSEASVKEGRRLFFTTLTNCSKCHGDLALGDGQANDFDEWTKDWTVPAKIKNPLDRGEIAPFLAAGVLEPRNIRPRNLRQGIFRGGRRPLDVYWRIKNGIAGTPMPAAASTLTDDDIWHLVDYVRSLQYDTLSQPGHIPDFQRERN